MCVRQSGRVAPLESHFLRSRSSRENGGLDRLTGLAGDRRAKGELGPAFAFVFYNTLARSVFPRPLTIVVVAANSALHEAREEVRARVGSGGESGTVPVVVVFAHERNSPVSPQCLINATQFRLLQNVPFDFGHIRRRRLFVPAV